MKTQQFSSEENSRISQMNSCHVGQKKKRWSSMSESQDEAEERMEEEEEEEEEEEDRDERR